MAMDFALPIDGVSERKPMSRWKAAALHLVISAAIAVTVIVLTLTLWYPRPYFEASGARFLLLLIVAVDVVIGPLITLVIFDTRKKSLKFDLGVIAALQLAALVYGVYTLYVARPVYAVYVGSRFELVSAADVYTDEMHNVKSEQFKTMPFAGPAVIAARMPQDAAGRENIMFSGAFGGGLASFPQHYVPYAELSAEALKNAQPIAGLNKFNDAAHVDAALASLAVTEADVAYLPMRAKHKNLTVILERNSGNVLGVVDLKPW